MTGATRATTAGIDSRAGVALTARAAADADVSHRPTWSVSNPWVAMQTEPEGPTADPVADALYEAFSRRDTKLDHVVWRGGALRAPAARIVLDGRDGEAVSDHFGLLVDFEVGRSDGYP